MYCAGLIYLLLIAISWMTLKYAYMNKHISITNIFEVLRNEIGTFGKYFVSEYFCFAIRKEKSSSDIMNCEVERKA